MQVCNKIIVVIGLLFIIFGLCLVDAPFASDTNISDTKKGTLINCDIQHQTCTQQIPGGSFIFDIQPKPVEAMKELTFKVQIKGVNIVESPVIDLIMPGMKMGHNQIMMKMTGIDAYQGTGIIVRCPSGKTVWQATVNFPGIGIGNFIFDVIY